MEDMPTVEIGPYRFRKNLRWLLCEQGISKGRLGQAALNTRLSAENGRKRICRLANGSVCLKVHEMEAIAGVFGIPAAVLAYGTDNQLKKSWENRHEYHRGS